jgi:colicin import membrane protein
VLLATPALADGWDMPDAVSKTVTASKDDSKDGERADKKDKADKEPDDSAGQRTTDATDEAPVDTPSITVRGGDDDPYQFSADAKPQADQPRDTRTSNVLGPLWGVPQDAPVMQNIDPELEKQYARDHEGRLVPRSELSKEDEAALREQEKQKAEQERAAKREQDRQEKEARAEQKRREKEARAAEKQREREEREAEKQRQREAEQQQKQDSNGTGADKQQDDARSDEVAEDAKPADKEDTAGKADAATDADDQAIYDSMGARHTPRDDGWW